MNKPMIALSARSQKTPFGTIAYYDNQSYFQFLEAGNGLGTVAYVTSEEEADVVASKCDGLLLTGGMDVDPSLYHEENTQSSLEEAGIDQSDILLYNAFKKVNKPILGICRGIQIINVAEGGTLIQDVPSYDEKYHEHMQLKMEPKKGMNDYAHTCSFVKGTVLHSLFGDEHMINSYHHQAVKDVAEGFTVSAWSDDGLVEGMEKENVLCVQWHPERLTFDPCHKAISEYFINKCSNQ